MLNSTVCFYLKFYFLLSPPTSGVMRRCFRLEFTYHKSRVEPFSASVSHEAWTVQVIGPVGVLPCMELELGAMPIQEALQPSVRGGFASGYFQTAPHCCTYTAILPGMCPPLFVLEAILHWTSKNTNEGGILSVDLNATLWFHTHAALPIFLINPKQDSPEVFSYIGSVKFIVSVSLEIILV